MEAIRTFDELRQSAIEYEKSQYSENDEKSAADMTNRILQVFLENTGNSALLDQEDALLEDNIQEDLTNALSDDFVQPDCSLPAS
jgi:hypothetical protein